ncbi:SpoIIE family protein phosphatase [Limibacter armeniacum]|uniref:SpoIIE family protein phosphatase n=1 Tax=Limibacter armeniacum TaxID=466084 RepID=UPI002FE5F39C
MNFKISLKLTILCLFLVLFTSMSLFYFDNREIQLTLKEQIINELTDGSDEAVKNIDRFLNERQTDVKMISKDPVLTSGASAETIMKRLKELSSINEMYYSFSFFNPNRIRMADSKGLSVGKQHTLTKYWIPLTDGEQFVMDISKSESVGQPVIHFASRVENDHNELVGFVVARVLITRLYEVFASHREGSMWDSDKLHVDLVDAKGLLLYSNHNPKGVLVEKYAFPEVVKEIRRKGSRSMEKDEQLFLVTDEKGYDNFNGNNWAMMLSLPLEEAYKPLVKVREKMLIVMSPIVLVCILLAVLAARYFSTPIVRLSSAADRIGHGDFETPIRAVRRRDELGVLATNLSKMAANLRKREEQQLLFQEELEGLNKSLHEKLNQINEHKEEISSQNMALEYAYNELERKSKQQTASINYAKKIQESMLPDKQLLYDALPDSFIYFKPRDIVSGDFYWYERIQKGGNDFLVVAAVDCTGHGVPGAIMAMLGSNLLTSIVCYGGFTDPAEILKRLNRDVRNELHQDREESQDGMEIAVCTINLNTRELYFAGAGRPLYIFRDQELIELQASKVNIGGSAAHQRKRNPETLISQYFELKENDILYLFSDGYKDQIGGPKKRIFTSRRLRGMLSEIHTKSANDQVNDLDRVFEGWKGDLGQTDDMLIVCLKMI